MADVVMWILMHVLQYCVVPWPRVHVQARNDPIILNYNSLITVGLRPNAQNNKDHNLTTMESEVATAACSLLQTACALIFITKSFICEIISCCFFHFFPPGQLPGTCWLLSSGIC